MKNLIVAFAIAALVVSACDDSSPAAPHQQAEKFSAAVAVQWADLQKDLVKTTPGFDPLVSARAYAYSGIALYESIVKGMPGYTSVASPMIGLDINAIPANETIHWPASANAAMATILKKLYGNTSAANRDKIDSLESVFETDIKKEINPEMLNRSIAYGIKVADLIFEWSKSDGGHESYLAATDPGYVPPTGPGKWIPTPAAFSQPVRPYWGNNRSFVPNSATTTMPSPPPSYSTDADSEFYKAVLELYQMSISLDDEDIKMVKHWGDLPGNYGTTSHYHNIATQLIRKKDLTLDEAAVVYAKHGMALYEATICVFRAKYTFNVVRPVSYLQNELGNELWTSVIGTPPHPEYPSAHAVIGGASYTVLENIFGQNYSFVDRTHEVLYGARSYDNLKAYASDAAWSRVVAGIHYKFSSEAGLAQGEKVGALINQVPFKSGAAN